MAATAYDRSEIKFVQLPRWMLPLAAAAAVAIIALAGAVGFGILLLMSPIILGVAAVQAIRHRQKSAPVAARRWPQRPQSSPPRAPIVIEGDFEVIDSGRQRDETGGARRPK